MEPITTSAELKNAIQSLEFEQVLNRQMLKDEFNNTVHGLKPLNLIKGTIREITGSPLLIDNVVRRAIGLISGLISKKIVVGTSVNLFRKFISIIIRLGISNAVRK